MQIRTSSKTSTAAAMLLLQACGGGGGGSSSLPPPVVMPPPEPPAIEIESVFSALSFERPVALLQAPGDDSRWFVVEQGGVVRTFANDPATDKASVFVDISAVVTSGGETGLLGMAFDPDFRASGEVYLSYTGNPGRVLTSVIARYRSIDGGATLDPASEEILLQVVQDFGNHNGGNIAFGPDGFLYVGLGDGGSGNDPNDRAQDTSNLLGAMLRIDVNGGSPYAIPAGNPFAGNAPCTQGSGGAPCPEIFAYGLRNPWRWSFDRFTGVLWLGDVGQADWEEVDVIEAGGNYGWRIREGAHCNDNIQPNCDNTGLTDPVWEYDHSQGQSITGGVVYRGRSIAGLSGFYLFGDFVSGRIWALPVDGSAAATEVMDSGLSVSAFAQDIASEAYIVDYSGGLYRIIASP
ncbi:MAG: PQQ-dependent sugar dehydrogenase [Gammaproteobacteria bacterium]|nr:MAG: PQQ-dependent sugar dehydrogenase [Gammaproteobacteria bacterium]